MTLSHTAALLLVAATLPAAAQTVCANIEVQNVRPAQGPVMVAAYTSETSYNKQALTTRRQPAGDAPVLTFELCGLTGGEVALMLYQDLDSDGKMGRNLIGLPIEPWGASGTPGMTGPKWDTTRVMLDGRTIVVRLSQ
ncbi:MAG: DUF2141 domain-containing protein [Chitinophagaceae bacterium]|nr:DUF2141 domain-containing protein [Rubrivivax sp.]